LSGFYRCGTRFDAPQLVEKNFVAGLIIDVVNVNILDNPFFVCNEDGALGIAL